VGSAGDFEEEDTMRSDFAIRPSGDDKEEFLRFWTDGHDPVESLRLAAAEVLSPSGAYDEVRADGRHPLAADPAVSRLVAALRARFPGGPRQALRALGLDEALQQEDPGMQTSPAQPPTEAPARPPAVEDVWDFIAQALSQMSLGDKQTLLARLSTLATQGSAGNGSGAVPQAGNGGAGLDPRGPQAVLAGDAALRENFFQRFPRARQIDLGFAGWAQPRRRPEPAVAQDSRLPEVRGTFHDRFPGAKQIKLT
jgi:hypothetical protein